MKFSTLIVASSAAAPVFALPQFLPGLGGGSLTGGSDLAGGSNTNGNWIPQEWTAPGSTDSRGPCPGLNTLANHGYLPRDGRNIDLKKLADGMLNGFNIENGDAVLLFTQAIRTSPKYPMARSFDLEDLGRHGILEHDISISRSDAYFADPNPFNQTVWEETLTYFPDEMITVEQVAKARMGRLETSKKTNPEHSLSALASGFSWGEMASFFEIMADGTTGTVKKDYIEYWFKNERMPTEIGWQRRNVTMRGSERMAFSRKLMEAAGVSRRDLTSDEYGRSMNQ